MDKEIVIEYIENKIKGLTYCPYCGSESIMDNDEDFDNEIVKVSWECLTCENTWEEVFQLVNLEMDDED